ncbi:MAG TPA: hypothetical protein VL752_18075 [Acidisoma sp.]|uniref:hypothetical protein n=1 Tax=Acidisoma sp. TaxID=1872115 RepID=UPI002C1E3D8B|nr:hypothetical protein [Acidisoma sp.]HTI02860.1 hypothetical protein [Acidisoma sp.]
MKRFCLTLAACGLLALSGCLHYDAPPDTAQLPPGAFHTNGDQDVAALDAAALGFAHAIIGNPGKAAYAIAALDYLGGELNSSPRWVGMDSLTRLEILDWRKKMRAEVGISATASSQDVVDTMLALSEAYRTNDSASVAHLLASPIFTVPPNQVADRLGNIPYNANLNATTMRADNAIITPSLGS